MSTKQKRRRANFSLAPKSIKALEALSRDMDMPMSRVIEAALDALRDKRSKARVSDDPRTWAEADKLLESLPTMEKKHAG